MIVQTWTGAEASALRRALRMSIRVFAEHLGAAVRTVAKWESAGAATVPSPVLQAALDTALERADAGARARFAGSAGGAARQPPTPWEVVGHGGVDTNRREATAALLALLATVTAAPAEGLGGAVARMADGGSGAVDRGLVASHEDLAATLSSAYRATHPRVLLPVVGGYADSVLGLLDRPMTPSQRTRLTVVAVGAHTESGLVAFNAGQWAAGYRALAVGRALAEELGDHGLHAQALGATSYLFSSALRGGAGGAPARAAALLDHALDIVPHSDGLVRGWLAGWRADQAAAQGDAQGALVDVEAAERALARPAPPRGFVHEDGCAYNVAGHLDGVRGQVDALLGRQDAAEDTIADALQTSGGPRQRVIVLVRLAGARVEAHDPDGAAAALAEAHRLADASGYSMGAQRVRGVRSRFDTRWTQLPAVVELDQQLAPAV